MQRSSEKSIYCECCLYFSLIRSLLSSEVCCTTELKQLLSAWLKTQRSPRFDQVCFMFVVLLHCCIDLCAHPSASPCCHMHAVPSFCCTWSAPKLLQAADAFHDSDLDCECVFKWEVNSYFSNEEGKPECGCWYHPEIWNIHRYNFIIMLQSQVERWLITSAGFYWVLNKTEVQMQLQQQQKQEIHACLQPLLWFKHQLNNSFQLRRGTTFPRLSLFFALKVTQTFYHSFCSLRLKWKDPNLSFNAVTLTMSETQDVHNFQLLMGGCHSS